MHLKKILSFRKKKSKLQIEVDELQTKVDFLLFEFQRHMEKHRWEEFTDSGKRNLQVQTKDSFDFQWNNLAQGKNLLSDKNFMTQLKHTICTYLGGEISLAGKKVADVGCGMGRFTYGLLSMGAKVTAMDQSPHGLEHVKELCSPWRENLSIECIDLLNVEEGKFKEQFDLVWCYGVVHHTGNTYLAMDHVCQMVKPGGMVFMMIYGFPDRTLRFTELAEYERLRFETRNMNNNEKVNYLKQRFPDDLVHGYFDAISPSINDILSFGEIQHFMMLEGFENIKQTVDSGNFHFIATKAAQ